jgi:hypothetical protein
VRHVSLLSSLFACGLPAQASWSMLYPTTSPALRVESTFAVHESTGKALLWWGSEGGQPATTAWVLTGNAWSLQPGTVPPPRLDPMVAFDAVRNELVVFGGQESTIVRDDTWRWNGTSWAQAPTGLRPPARYAGAMAFDRQRGVVVLHGGLSSVSPPVFLTDTWEWNGSMWQQRPTTVAPPARGYATMAFDPVGGGVLLHGGVNFATSLQVSFTDTWTWNGTAWQQRQPATPPPSRLFHRMVTDVHRQRIVLLGGVGIDLFAWEWDGAEWAPRYQPSPGARFMFGMGYDAVQRRIVVHGGAANMASQTYFLSDTWVFRTALPADVAAFGAGCAGTGGTPVLANAPFVLPWLGDTMRNVVQPLPAGGLGAIFVSSFGTTLPVPLGGVGAPGCELLVPVDVVELRAANGTRAEWSLAIPNVPSLAAATFRQQAFVIDAAANALGLAASNAVTVTLGVR